MGIAASQARYLSLLARQSDCEYQGQQIQQSILSLSNKSSKLFAQMLDMNVPTPPSKTDFTKVVYEYKDPGTGTTYTIKNWQVLTDDPEGYNYVVTYTSDAPEEEGVQSFITNPQVQFVSGDGSSLTYEERATRLRAAKENIDTARADYATALSTYNALVAKGKVLSNYANIPSDLTHLTNATPSGEEEYPASYTINKQEYATDTAGNQYAVYTATIPPEEEGGDPTQLTVYRRESTDTYYTRSAEEPYVYTEYPLPEGTELVAETEPVATLTNYNSLSDTDKGKIDTAIDQLEANGALEEGYDKTKLYYNENYGIIFQTDILNISTKNELPVYSIENINTTTTEINEAKNALPEKEQAITDAETIYYTQDVPSYMGNTELTLIQSMTVDQATAVKKIIEDVGSSSSLKNCFKPGSTEYTPETYNGQSLYTYTKNGVTNYVSFDDLATSYLSAESENQTKLPVYSVVEQTSSKPRTSKAFMERDPATGRFTSVRFPDDAVTHTLTVKETSDEEGYEDAMQQYNYNMAMYDKAVADINAQTSIINSQDKILEMKLSQLDIERTALKTELESVQKVLKENVERSFKTFGN